MAAKKASAKVVKAGKVVKAAKPVATQPTQVDLEGVDLPLEGAHPWLHDIERAEALRVTASRDGDKDIALLRRLLADAHARLADETREDANLAAAEKKTKEWEVEAGRLEKELQLSEAKVTAAEQAASATAFSDAVVRVDEVDAKQRLVQQSREHAKFAQDIVAALPGDVKVPAGADWQAQIVEYVKNARREFDARLATAEAKAAVSGGEWCRKNREEGEGPCGACSLCCAEMRAEVEAAVEKIRTEYNALLTACHRKLGELTEVEPLATAFAMLVAVDLCVEKLPPEHEVVVKSALDILGIGDAS